VSEVDDEIAAAYACDRKGDERGAIVHYERAFSLGVPESERRHFLVGYGSTLRNVGRADDALGLLGEAVAADPEYAPFRAFLALALLSAGHARPAVATLLGLALDVADLDGFERALTAYHDELLAER
jgi:tetratricopeptide (TPR) repeat protein